MQKLVIATRSSPLALWQARYVAEKLVHAGLEIELKPIETIGDKKLEVTLSKIGDKGVFTQELEQMLLNGEAHLAVHSAKDMPSKLPEGLEIVAFTERENPVDVLVSHNPEVNLEDPNLVLGTSSTRRIAILKRNFPHIQTVPVRGNLQTRIRKMEEGACHALVLAYAGVARMGFSELIRSQLRTTIFTPAVGQGALAIEINSNLPNPIKEQLNAVLHHAETGIELFAERAFLRAMEGGCSVPVFGLGRFVNQSLSLSGGIVSLDGSAEIRVTRSFSGNHISRAEAENLGSEVAEAILTSGGALILSEIKQNLHPGT